MVSSPEAREALQHYEVCSECQAFFATHLRVTERLRSIAEAQRAPSELRARVLAAIKQEQIRGQHPRWARRRVFGGAALVAAAAAVVVWLALPKTPDARVAEPFVVQAVQGSPRTEELITGDAAPLEEWLAVRTGGYVHVPDIPDAKLVGGEVTHLGDVQTVAVRYRLQGRDLTYFALPAGHTLGPTVVQNDKMVSLASQDHQGYEVVFWGEEGSARVLVAPLSRAELQAIAEHCRGKRMS